MVFVQTSGFRQIGVLVKSMTAYCDCYYYKITCNGLNGLLALTDFHLLDYENIFCKNTRI